MRFGTLGPKGHDVDLVSAGLRCLTGAVEVPLTAGRAPVDGKAVGGGRLGMAARTVKWSEGVEDGVRFLFFTQELQSISAKNEQLSKYDGTVTLVSVGALITLFSPLSCPPLLPPNEGPIVERTFGDHTSFSNSTGLLSFSRNA